MTRIDTAPPTSTTPNAEPATTTSALRVIDLSTVFHTGAIDVRAVRSVSFAIQPGQTLVLLGESGSGKSVTARAIMQLHGRRAEVAGQVILGNQSVLDLDEKAMRRIRGGRIALVPQDPSAALDPLRRVGRQISEVLLVHKQCPSRAAAKERAIELLRQVGIPDPQRAYRSFPHELSGGMRQRVVIAIAVSCDPAVIVADEPTTALDVTVQAQILDLFAELQARLSTALLLVTHDVLVAADVADVIAVMYAGSIVETGPARQILDAPRHPYTKALLGALPQPDTVRGELESIPGAPPVAGQDFPGCAFADRCRFVQDSCREQVPALSHVGRGHLAACPVLNPTAEPARVAEVA